ncbi:cell division protein FtsB [Lysobacter psychrotolerans]|uniref:Cell division protein FtsB n=1 Tax=Montanilutibacter psychrotolerans TaxID=1327343 RepID=A0A3M8SV43_9GAMM|nr:cell division protein FtsB [Lysobacter psychrotolerans]
MRWRLLLLVVLAALFAALQYRLWFGEGGDLAVAALRDQVRLQTRDNAGLQQRNDALAAEVEDLKSGEEAVEERARSELGMIKPGETFYRVVEAPAVTNRSPSLTAPAGEAGVVDVPAEVAYSGDAPVTGASIAEAPASDARSGDGPVDAGPTGGLSAGDVSTNNTATGTPDSDAPHSGDPQP